MLRIRVITLEELQLVDEDEDDLGLSRCCVSVGSESYKLWALTAFCHRNLPKGLFSSSGEKDDGKFQGGICSPAQLHAFRA